MDAWIDKAMSNPFVMVILMLILGALAYAALKRLLKMALIFGLGFLLVTGYFWWTKKTPPPAVQKVQDGIANGLEKGAQKGAKKVKRTARKVARDVTDEIKKTAKEETKKAVENAKKTIED